MELPTNSEMLWSEESSHLFIDRGHIYTPTRDEIQATMLDLIPADNDDTFLAVELGVGSGWLSAAILERYPAARVLGLDGSPAMLRETATRLQTYSGRFELRPFRLEDNSWLTEVGHTVRCFVSSLVIHHLDAASKQTLYRELYKHLEVGGGTIITDIVAPRSGWERRQMARAWNTEVKKQSLAMTGALHTYQQFVDEQWNWYDYPDPMDMPSTVPEHLQWLAEAGYTAANVFWERAGHAIYGAYKMP